MKRTFIEEYQRIKNTFVNADRRVLYIVLLEILIILLTVFGFVIWNQNLSAATADVPELRGQLEAIGGITNAYGSQLRDDTAAEILSTFFLMTLALFIFIWIVWSTIKNKIYNMVLETRFSRKIYWRFVLMSALWAVFAFIVFMIYQTVIFRFFARTIETSFMSRAISFILLATGFFILYWWSINFFTHIIREQKVVKAIKRCFTTSIMKFGRFLIPLLFSLILVILINLLMYLVMLTGHMYLFLIVSTILTLILLTLLRFYYTAVIDSIECGSPVRGRKRSYGGAKRTARKHRRKKR